MAQNTKCACAGYNTTHCKQGCSTIVIDFSDSDSHDMFKDPPSSTDAGGMLDAIAEDIDEDDDCPTPPRPKKSKGTHARAAL